MQKPLRLNPPVTTDPEIIELGGGLDYTRPKLKVEPGSLLDVLNFEVIDRGGYARIAGCEPYDGTTAMEATTYYRVADANFPYVDIATDYPVGMLLYAGASDTPFGITVASAPASGYVFDNGLLGADPTLDFIVLDPTVQLTAGTLIKNDSGGGVFEVWAYGVSDMSTGRIDALAASWTAGSDAKDFIDTFNAAKTTARNEISALPNRPIGLHWFRDRLYAVANDVTIYFDSGSTEILPNMFVGSGTATGRVLYVSTTGGSWGLGTARGYMQIDNFGTIGAWTNNSVINTFTDGTFGVVLTADVATVAQVADVTGVAEPLYAGLFVSRSEAQAAAEDEESGWSWIDSGWAVGYDAGYAESGYLTKIEKGTTPNYTPGTGAVGPTTANILMQAVTVEDDIAQVQGWKSTAAETVYATDATAVSADDNVYLYGDFITQGWGLNTGGIVYTQQPSGGVGESSTFALQENDANGQTLAFTVPGAYSTTIHGSNGYTYFILRGVDGLSSGLPSNARIAGITVSVKYDAEVLYKGWPHSDADVWATFQEVKLEAQLMDYDTDTTTATKLGSAKTALLDFTFANFTETHDETVGSERKARWTKNAESTITFGSSTDLWGLSTLTRAIAGGEGFSVGFRGRVDCGSTSVAGNSNDNICVYRPLIDYITVSVAYVTDSVRYYFSDGAGNIIQGDLVYYTTVEGTFATGDAEGTMQLVNVVKYAGAKYNIQNNMTIHTASTVLSASQVGVVDGNMVYNGLPGLDSILDANSRYQFITSNFYGTDGLDGFYGVSGADKAFSVNTFLNGDLVPENQEYLVKITTNPLDETGDTPRHVANHHNHLALGFSSGIVRLSVGGEPENFNGTDGAAEVGVGDKVTGLLSMRGTTLGVFCENSIWGISGTDDQNYETNVLAPYTGALEYTVVDMGIPMYCDSRGISTLEQSAAYGNFLGKRLSAPVTSWILPRMIRYTDLESTSTSKGVACAFPVRSKNQYRVAFRDGKVLVATINPDALPSFTFSTYYIGQTATTETDKYLVPLAWSSQVDQRGVERIHVSHYSPTSDISEANSKYVYELERGWGFAGKFIPAFFATNWTTKDPYKEKSIKNVRMDGLSYGYGSSRISIAKEYEEVYNTVKEPISLPPVPSETLSDELKATTSMAYVAATGRNLSLKVEDFIATGDTIDDPIPPCIHQIMLTQYAPEGKTDS